MSIPRPVISLWRHITVALLLPAGMLLGASGKRMERTFDTTSEPRIAVANLKGTIVIKSWDKSEVHAVCVTASPELDIDSDQMPARGQAAKVSFAVHRVDPRVAPEDDTADYTLEIPVDSSVEIHNPEGSVTIDRLTGDDWVESVDGKIFVYGSAGHVAVRSLKGDIEITRPSGRVEASSVMGNLRFIDASSPSIRAQTVSGNIFFDGDFLPEGEYALSSYQGNMDITCPASDSFEVRARTIHGKFDNQFQLTKKHHPSSPYGTGLFGVHNQGDATVQLRSYKGTIRLRPRP